MRIGFLLASALVAAPLALPASSAEAQRQAARVQDWTRVAVRTPEGGFRMGNPNAPVKVVEYLSLTCPHCAAFAHEGSAGLLGYVRTGRVSIEYRNYILNGVDVSAALLVRCASPVNYFTMSHALLGSQQSWMGRVSGISQQQRQEISQLQPLQVAQRLVPLLGLDAIGLRYGITPALRQRCMTQAALNQLDQLHSLAQQQGVQGTPTFFINGAMANTNTWAGLEPLLRGR